MRRSLMLLLLAAPAFAGVYSPDDPCPFTVNADGTADPLPNDLFVAMLVDRMAPRVPNLPTTPGIPDWKYEDGTARSTYAARLGQLLMARWPKADQLRGDDLLSHTAALLRFDATQPALNLLDRGRVGRSYTLKANRTHAFATSRDWADAVTNLPDEPDTAPPPPPGTSDAQFRWQRTIDQGAYRRWLEVRDADAKRWKTAADRHPDAAPFALFSTPDGTPIRFWESAEAVSKLPADAVAVVQQLLLWAPWDDRLLWTLAELYAAKGKVREAYRAYKMLASDDGRRYEGPRLLGPQVRRVGEAFSKLPAEDSTPVIPPDDTSTPPPPETSNLVFGLIDPVAFYSGVGVLVAVVALMVILQVRAIRTRLAGRGSDRG